MLTDEREALRTAITALEGQRASLGEAVLALATAPLRARLAALSRPAGLQHRQVTVLFADVVGSTAMAQRLDAEETLAVLSGTLQRMAALVDAQRGRVLRFTGDGLKAAFGMDETREDDAERAVRAGLAILELGREQAVAAERLHGLSGFAVRVGVHSGDVALGAGVEADNTAMGAAVNIAARMEQSAPPGALRISHDTWSQVRGLFEMQPQPPLHVKGVDAPLQTYLVHAALDRSTASLERGLQGLATPMVGRQAELQRLLDAGLRVRRVRQLQALTLLGDAGLGKSRLLREFKAALAAEGHGLRLLTLRAQPDGQLRPWGLLRSLLALRCGVADTDSAEVARRKVVAGLGPVFAADGERQARLIGQLSGLDFADSAELRGLDPRMLRDQALAALIAYLQALAAPGRPMLALLVEDLHWCDDSSLDLLQHLLAQAAVLPLLLVMTARPALLARRPDWCPPGPSPHTCLTLAPLAGAQSEELARALLQRMASVPARLAALLTRQCEGNPYYMEELVRRLIDDGLIQVDGRRWTVQAERLDTLRLPTTLVGLLQARLDALPPAQRQAARQASVIGHVFWDDALQALDDQAPQALPALQRTAYVREHERSDFEGTRERQFDHHLLHQVTYDTLLKAERRSGHGAAARWLAERTQGRGAEFLAMTGEHAARAGDTTLAVCCFEQAGEQAQARFANADAQSYLRRALGLLADAEPRRRFALLQRLENIGETAGDRAAQDMAQAEMATLLERHPDDANQARLLVFRGLLAERRGDRAACQRHVEQAAVLAQRSGDAWAAARALHLLAWTLARSGDLTLALQRAEQSVSWAGRIDNVADRERTEQGSMANLALVLYYLGRYDEAGQINQRVLAWAEARGSLQAQHQALVGMIAIASDLGRFEQMREHSARLLKVAGAMGATGVAGVALYSLGEAEESLGNHAAALPWYEQALSACRAAENWRKVALLLFGIGRAHGSLGDAGTALQWHAQAQAAFDALGPSLHAEDNRACAALCHARVGQADAARAAVDAVLERLAGDLAREDAKSSMPLRWSCQLTLAALGDARAAPLLAQLHADVRASAEAAGGAAEQERLIQALPVWRAIVAAHRCSGEAGGGGRPPGA